jgi:hypothetical protein
MMKASTAKWKGVDKKGKKLAQYHQITMLIRAAKVKESDDQSSNDCCQSPKPSVLVVLGRGPQGDGVEMQGCDVVERARVC